MIAKMLSSFAGLRTFPCVFLDSSVRASDALIMVRDRLPWATGVSSRGLGRPHFEGRDKSLSECETVGDDPFQFWI